MPAVFCEKGFTFFFFSNEGNPLEPCHIHVRKDGNLAKFWVTDKVSLADSYGFSADCGENCFTKYHEDKEGLE